MISHLQDDRTKENGVFRFATIEFSIAEKETLVRIAAYIA
jgi:hypothetical protein